MSSPLSEQSIPARFQSVGALLSHCRADSPAILAPGQSPLTHLELAKYLEFQAGVLKNFGVNRNSRVAIILPQGAQLATTCLCLMSVAVCIPLNPDYTENEFEYFFDALEIEFLITLEKADCAAQRLVVKKNIALIYADDSTSITTSLRLKFGPDSGPLNHPQPGVKAISLKSDIALILHTSGSTSKPKKVSLTHTNILASIDHVIQSLRLEAQDCCLNMMPLFHIGALVDLLLSPLASGGSVIVTEDMSSASFLQNVEAFNPNWFQAVPTMLQSIVEHRSERKSNIIAHSSFRFIRSVSSALPNRLLHAVEELFDCPVIEIYGMTETCGLITSNPLPPEKRKQGSVGVAVGTEVAIINTRGATLQPNHAGEIMVRGPNVMMGYEDSPVQSENEFVNGWLKTGDEGYLDQDGFLYITGRSKEMINRGGEKISPLEVDRVIQLFPAVKQAATFGAAHNSLGEDVSVALVVDNKIEFNELDFYHFLESKLARFKIPRKYYLVDRLPRTIGGKLQRHLVADYIQQNSKRGQKKNRKPETETQLKLAQIWSDILLIQAVNLDDNFFDLGGDSLKAAVLMLELEKWLKSEVHMSILYEAPTLVELDMKLAQYSPVKMYRKAELSAALYKSLSGLLAGWQGERLTQNSLLVGRNTQAQKQPLFWCINAYSEFDQLATRMGPDQAIYGMRSLYKTEFKTALNNELLAQFYVKEIQHIQRAGPYYIGGFCEAGKIAFLIAQELLNQGQEVASLMLQEQFVAERYARRIAMFICSAGPNSPYYKFYNAQQGWRKFYSGDLVLYKIRARHHKVYRQPEVEVLAAQIKHELKLAQESGSSRPTYRNSLQQLPETGYKANITTAIVTSLPPLYSAQLDVTVTNLSSISWLPTPYSGLYLGARWTNMQGLPRIYKAGFAELEQVLQPGASVTMTLKVKTPWRYRNRILEIDMVDDGVSWFSDKGSEPARFAIKFSILEWLKVSLNGVHNKCKI